MGHTLRMLIACVLPLLAIFLLPLFGISDGPLLLVLIVLLFVGHLWMIAGHDHAHPNDTRSHGDHRHGTPP